MCASESHVLRLLSLVLLLFANTTNAISFELDGKVVQTEKKEQILVCGDYRLKIVFNDFPFEYEAEVPAALRVKGYYGPDNHRTRDVKFFPGNQNIPDLNLVPELKSQLLPERTYLATKAKCTREKFVIFYWSGGKCRGCEAYVEYEVKDRKPVNPKLVSYQVIKDAY